jgi:hypothetical protein
MLRLGIAASMAFAVVAIAGSTDARPAPGSASRPARMHSGFTFRFSLGAAVLRDLVAIESAAGAADGDEDTGVVTGFGSSYELTLGWVIERGIALGFYMMEDDGQSGSAEFDTEGVSVPETSSLFNFGVFLSYYPVPGGPWHMSGGIGIGSADSITRDDSGEAVGDINPDIATGLGAFFGGGYEWRFSRSWAIGAALRAQIIDGSDSEPSVVRHRSVGFALLASMSYN